MNRRRRGSMLVEAIIALTVLTVVVGGFSTLTASKTMAIADASARATATRAADAEMARLRSLEPAELRRQHNKTTPVPGLVGGSLRVTVKKTDGPLLEVRTRVTWRLRTGTDDSIVLYTLMAGEKE